MILIKSGLLRYSNADPVGAHPDHVSTGHGVIENGQEASSAIARELIELAEEDRSQVSRGEWTKEEGM